MCLGLLKASLGDPVYDTMQNVYSIWKSSNYSGTLWSLQNPTE